PPVGWADVATKGDLGALEERLNLRFDVRLHSELRSQMRTLFLGMLTALLTITSLCLAAIALAR
ncbi:MAG: hypothetical protein JWP02_2094, partial [Acidimicrobiales bacterium]|nr:hypothetical protein [Acidimicrobiales bacterium]